MAKCYICGNDCKNAITIEGYNHKATICGMCALDNGIIIDPDIVELIREAEGLPKGKACNDCKYLLDINNGVYLCQRFDVPLCTEDVMNNYCECFTRRHK